jgi:hypothetical protein
MRRHCPVRQSRPRVSPGTEGGGGPAHEHASKEEVAPTGVTVVSIGGAEQSFHPGKRPPQRIGDEQ